jgi:hypothetical protein
MNVQIQLKYMYFGQILMLKETKFTTLKFKEKLLIIYWKKRFRYLNLFFLLLFVFHIKIESMTLTALNFRFILAHRDSCLTLPSI